MQINLLDRASESPVFQWLQIALLISIAAELSLLAGRLVIHENIQLFDSVQNFFHILTLSLLLVIVWLRHKHQDNAERLSKAAERQIQALLTMFSAVRHDLNNDMQVVVGNSELAQQLLDAGGNLRKPINNISEAANLAVERIEQLSVFNNSGLPIRKAIDLNATLREGMAKLSSEIPAIVVLRLELEHLPIRVLADRYLLGLSLSHLIRQTAKTMQHGGEIVVRTRDLAQSDSRQGTAVANLEVFIVRALASATDPCRQKEDRQTDNLRLTEGFEITKALVERSGAVMVGHSVANGGSLINMSFVSDVVIEPSIIAKGSALGESVF